MLSLMHAPMCAFTQAELDLRGMQWSFVLGVFLAKFLVFLLVLVLSIMLTGSQGSRGVKYILSGLRGEDIFSLLETNGTFHPPDGN
jgi:hypothetical protein